MCIRDRDKAALIYELRHYFTKAFMEEEKRLNGDTDSEPEGGEGNEENGKD